MLFPEVLKCWKLNFQYYCQIKMSEIKLFWSMSQFKMLQNIMFRLNRVNKILQNPKIVQKTHEIKIPRKFHAVKTSCLKLYARNFKYTSLDIKRRSIKEWNNTKTEFSWDFVVASWKRINDLPRVDLFLGVPPLIQYVSNSNIRRSRWQLESLRAGNLIS